VGVLTGKKREILQGISRFLLGCSGIVQTFAMGRTQGVQEFALDNMLHYTLRCRPTICRIRGDVTETYKILPGKYDPEVVPFKNLVHIQCYYL